MKTVLSESEVFIEDIEVSVYKIPSETPESDGTYSWDHTMLVLVEITAGDVTGVGYTYADTSTAELIRSILSKSIHEDNVLNIPLLWNKMIDSIRNLGRPGIASMAISAVDVALWDLKAKILDLPLVHLLGSYKKKIPIYGSGGFTNYDQREMEKQLKGWLKEGIKMMKIKIGSHPDQDVERVKFARKIIGKENQLFVDANGAYTKKQALNLSYSFAEENVTWFEEPVSSDDVDGLRFLSESVPSPINITTGEYGYDLFYFKRLLENKAVDILQADATRCGGISGFLRIASLAEAYNIPLSSHCAPYLHLPLVCSLRQTIHSEYFFDHVRIERMLFDGAAQPANGFLVPDLSRPGLGIEFKKKDAEKFLV